jgi:DNA repair exonuclease SbcCD ATPase subunit
VSDIAAEDVHEEANPDQGSAPARAVPEASNGSVLPSTGDSDARARAWQSRYDQEVERRKALESRLQALETAATPPSVSTRDVEEAAARAFHRYHQFAGKVTELRNQYPDVEALRPTLFNDLSAFDSIESLEAAVMSEAEKLDGIVQTRVAEKENEIKEAYAGQYGRRLREPVDSGQAGQATGLPSVEQLADMRVEELEKVDAQYGAGTVDKILAEAIPSE